MLRERPESGAYTMGVDLSQRLAENPASTLREIADQPRHLVIQVFSNRRFCRELGRAVSE
jgi:hypothetical protein